MRLARSRQWLRLGRWRRGVFGGYRSEVDGDDFFLSPSGKRNPQAELEATIRGFVLGPGAVRPFKREIANSKDISSHPRCRFPARLMWLNTRLGLGAQLKLPDCPGLLRFLKRLQPGSVALVFSSHYLNNPASAFGHSLLRIGRGGSLAVGQRRELLDYGVNYSAEVDTANALVYGFKGLFGMFRGTFKMLPYYYKVREYNDYESRDLWEYELDLPPEAVRLLAAHLWELGSTYFDYFYASENCSYHILSMLEAADPRLELLRHLGWPVVPAETVKALYANPGLVKSVRRRPALREQFRQRIAGMSAQERRWVDRLAQRPDLALPKHVSAQRQIPLLDAALDLVDVRYAKALVHKKDPRAASLKQGLLERRAAIHRPSAPVKMPAAPPRTRPDRGHGSRRVGLGVGFAEQGKVFQSFRFRLALHDLADPAAGYPDLSQLEFFAVDLRLRYDTGDLLLRDLALFRIISLAAMDRFNPKFSWNVDFTVSTVEDAGCDECTGPRLAGGFGAALAFWDEAVTVFAFSQLLMRFAPGLDGMGGIPLRAGLGPAAGLRVRWRGSLVTFVSGHWIWLPGQDPLATWQSEVTTRWAFTRDVALGLEGRLGPAGAEAQLATLVYF